MRARAENRRRRHDEALVSEAFTISYTSFSLILLALFIFLDSITVPSQERRRDVLGSIVENFLATPLQEPSRDDTFGIASTAERASFEIIPREAGFLVRMPGESLFESGDDTIKFEVVDTLKDIAERIRVNDLNARIVGHTDDRPIQTVRFRSNWELSVARAVSVLRLFQESDVPIDRLSAAGKASFDPVGSNETPEGRAKNRRVEVMILPPEGGSK